MVLTRMKKGLVDPVGAVSLEKGISSSFGGPPGTPPGSLSLCQHWKQTHKTAPSVFKHTDLKGHLQSCLFSVSWGVSKRAFRGMRFRLHEPYLTQVGLTGLRR